MITLLKSETALKGLYLKLAIWSVIALLGTFILNQNSLRGFDYMSGTYPLKPLGWICLLLPFAVGAANYKLRNTSTRLELLLDLGTAFAVGLAFKAYFAQNYDVSVYPIFVTLALMFFIAWLAFKNIGGASLKGMILLAVIGFISVITVYGIAFDEAKFLKLPTIFVLIAVIVIFFATVQLRYKNQ